MLAEGFLYSQRLPLRRPGAFQLRTAVRDEATGRTGSAGEYLEIPDVAKGELAVSGLVIRSSRATAAEQAAEVRERIAVRTFPPGSKLSYNYHVYNLSSDASKKSRIELQMRLFRNGVQVFAGAPSIVPFEYSPQKTHTISGTLGLNSEMAPGRYVLQVHHDGSGVGEAALGDAVHRSGSAAVKRVLALAVLALSLWAATPATHRRGADRDGSRRNPQRRTGCARWRKRCTSSTFRSGWTCASSKNWRARAPDRSPSRNCRNCAMPRASCNRRPRRCRSSSRPAVRWRSCGGCSGAAHVIALDYSKSLPDFICTQMVRRFDTATGRWQLHDTLEVKLTYFGQKEDYKLLSVNGRSAATSYSSIGGAISQGEFGSLLRLIFDAKSAGRVPLGPLDQAAQTAGLRVFLQDPGREFHVTGWTSSAAAEYAPRYSTVPGQRGFVWVDRETNRILRIFAEADDIQRRFPGTQLVQPGGLRIHHGGPGAISCCRCGRTCGWRAATC